MATVSLNALAANPPPSGYAGGSKEAATEGQLDTMQSELDQADDMGFDKESIGREMKRLGGEPKMEKVSAGGTVSLNAMAGVEMPKTPAKEEKFKGQRLLMNAAAAGDVVAGVVPQVLGLAGNAAAYATDIALGKSHKEATAEGRAANDAINEKLGNPLRRLLDHLSPEGGGEYDDSTVNKAMTKVSSWLDKGVDKVVEKTDGRVSKQDAETMRDWLMVFGPVGVGKIAKGVVGKATGDVEKTGGVNKSLVEDYKIEV